MRSNNCDFSISRYQNCYIYMYLYAVGWTCSFLLVNPAGSARFNPHFWLVLLTVGRVRLVARNSLQTHGYGFLKGSHRKKKHNYTIYHLFPYQSANPGRQRTHNQATNIPQWRPVVIWSPQFGRYLRLQCGAPPVINCFISPSTIDISWYILVNYWCYKPTFSYLGGTTLYKFLPGNLLLY